MNNITLFVTRKCNLNCSYCFQRHSDINMSKDLADQVIQIVKRYHVKNVSFFGGEPLINWKIIKYTVDQLRNNKTTFGLITNGLLIDDGKIDFINNNKIKLAFSYDGNRTYKRTSNINEIKKIKKDLINCIRKIDSLTICMTICTDNISGFAFDVIRLYEKGAKNIEFSLDSWNCIWTDQDFKKLREECRIILMYCINQYKIGNKIVFSDFYEIYQTKLGTMKCVSCRFGLDNFVIDAEGLVYPCMSFAEDKSISIGTISDILCIEDALYYLKIEKIKNQFKHDNNEKCKNCIYIRYCVNDCCCKNYIDSIRFSQHIDCKLLQMKVELIKELEIT